MDDDAIETSASEDDVITTQPPGRDLIGHFGADTPSRGIAKAIIAARQKRNAKQEVPQRLPAKGEPKS